jgi:hypothetical protein
MGLGKSRQDALHSSERERATTVGALESGNEIVL